MQKANDILRYHSPGEWKIPLPLVASKIALEEKVKTVLLESFTDTLFGLLLGYLHSKNRSCKLERVQRKNRKMIKGTGKTQLRREK